MREKILSRAVVANNGGAGCVLWYSGPDIQAEVGDLGVGLEDLGLWTGSSSQWQAERVDVGICIWEGIYEQSAPDYDEFMPNGVFRVPTAEEWEAIRAGRSPWPMYEACGCQAEPDPDCEACGGHGWRLPS